MKTLQSKILKPFIIILLVAQISTFTFFNFSMAFYAEKNIKDELINILDNIEPLVSMQFNGKNLSGSDPQSAEREKSLNFLRNALRLSKMAMKTEMFVLNPRGEIIFPSKAEADIAGDLDIRDLRLKFDQAGENELTDWNEAGNHFYAAFRSLDNKKDPFKLVLIVKNDGSIQFIRFVNLINGIILLAMAFFSIFTARILSKSIVKPVNTLCNQARNIAKGKYDSLPENSDCAEIQILARQFNEMSQLLKEQDKMQKTFLQNASHELRTPLMSIQGYAEGIAKGIFTETEKTAEIIQQESNRLKVLVEQLLTLSRIETIAIKRELTAVNLTGMLKEYRQRLEGYALKENKEILFDTLTETIIAYVDEEMLWQAVSNVLSNSVSHSRKRVRINISRDEDFVKIDICDDGPGIDEADLPHIFERFYKGKGGNFGLGLSIAFSAMAGMGGGLKAFNRIDGACFSLFIPVRE
jgi:two-component system sensor histidine kinase CssS